MSRPISKGIQPNYILHKTLARQFKVDRFLSALPLSAWPDFTKVVDTHVLHHNKHLKSGQETFDTLVASFQVISYKKSFPALSSYFSQVLAYYMEKKKEFVDTYDHKVEKHKREIALSSEMVEKVMMNLKKESLSLHEKYLRGDILTDSESKRLSDLEQNSIAKEDWHMFCKAIKEKYTIHKKKLSKKIIENWYLIAKLAENTKSLEKSRQLLEVILVKERNDYCKKIYKIFEFVLDLYEENEFMFKEGNEEKVTEQDYISAIWSPLLKKVHHLHGKSIRLKTQTRTGKTDYRFVVDVGNKQVDLGVGEAIRRLDDYPGRLVREGKDVVDRFLQICSQSSPDQSSSFILQTAGLCGKLSSVQIIQPQVYAAVPHFTVDIPPNISCLAPFIDTLRILITMTQKMECMAQKILISHEYGQPKISNNYKSWSAQTFYFPKTHESTRKPTLVLK
ncbi:uncharacterized protein EV154DRAFT_482606 [Mucor mucedo]|uniref:uncharacterized protein n=1 Tax=Mucor mucedo TaxID=29922 RepID=UPI00222108DB|nr:uncharacterized protein EV154DRAFT_482606 [Mucor mucedo]KAI7890043.1 hypothetical protein EV154DRAFT_482606 [Mucor mucedo]